MANNFPYQIIDLTHIITPDIPTWDNNCGFKYHNKVDYADIETEVKFRVQQVDMYAGIGTHMDAPAHCIEGGNTIEKLSLDDLIVPAYCIDVSKHCAEDYLISEHEVLKYEAEHGPIEKGSLVVFYTGWSKHWSDRKQYHNNFKFPSVSIEAAKLLFERGIVGLGIDTLSSDVPASGFPVHQLMLGAGRYLVENVANADKLPAKGSYVMVMPIKGADLTEAPVRLVGLVEK